MINLKKLFNLEFYTSPLDLFLAKYNQDHQAKSESQRIEKQKFDRIFNLRDQEPAEPGRQQPIWDKF